MIESISSGGRSISFQETRHCSICHDFVNQVCFGIRYSQPERWSETYKRSKFWRCCKCGRVFEEVNEIPAPAEEDMLIRRLLKLGSDYDIKSYRLNVEARKITVEVGFYPFDTTHIRAIICKTEDEYFITVQELQQLEKAGVRKLEDQERFLGRPLRFRSEEYLRERAIKTRLALNPTSHAGP